MKQKYITAKKFYKKAKQKVEIAQQIYKQLTKTQDTQSYQQGELGSIPNKKTSSSRQQYQKRYGKTNAKVAELEKKLSDTN